MRIATTAALAVALVFGASSHARAQAWDVPAFLAPQPSDDLGLYYVRPSGDTGDGNGVAGIWRQTGNLNLGVRGGVVDMDAAEDLAWFVGAEAFGLLFAAGQGLPVDVGWSIGAGGSFVSDVTWVRIPAGVTIGTRLPLGGLVVAPYAFPRVAFDIFASDGDSTNETTIVTDIGADLYLGPSWIIRAGASLGDYDGFGVGVAWRMARGVRVE